MKKITLCVSVFFCAVLLTACSVGTEKCIDVNQDRIHQSLSATYYQERTSTSAYIQLRFGDWSGTTLELSGNCNVSHDSLTLQKNVLSGLVGTSYGASGDGKISDHTFVFTDNASNTFTNTGSLPADTAFDNAPAQISKTAVGSRAVNISFTGGALAASETMTLYIQDNTSDSSSTSVTSASEIQNSEGATTVPVPTRVSLMSNGDKEMYLRRSKTIDLQEVTSSGGGFTSSFETSKVTVELVD